MPTSHERSLRVQLYDYLHGLAARVRFGNGGGSNLEVRVQPNSQGGGVYLHLIDNGGQEYSLGGKIERTERRELYAFLTPKNARRVAHALLFMAGESDVDEHDEVLTPE